MSNLPVVVKTLGNKSIKWVVSLQTHINGVVTIGRNPPDPSLYKYTNRGDRNFSACREYNRFFGRFLFSPNFMTHDHDNDDGFAILHKRVIRAKMYQNEDAILARFVSEGEEEFYPVYKPIHIKKLHYVVKYMEVNESIIAYLQQTGDEKLASMLREKFLSCTSDLDEDEILAEKARELLSINLFDYFRHFPKKNTMITK